MSQAPRKMRVPVNKIWEACSFSPDEGLPVVRAYRRINAEGFKRAVKMIKSAIAGEKP